MEDLIQQARGLMKRWCAAGDQQEQLVVADGMADLLATMVERAGEVAPHDEGTSYCTSIPGACPVHDAR
jgi:hypothetical protein